MTEDGLKAKERVLAVHPGARSFQWTGYWRIYATELFSQGSVVSAAFRDEEAAWIDAASKLPPQATSEAAYGTEENPLKAQGTIEDIAQRVRQGK